MCFAVLSFAVKLQFAVAYGSGEGDCVTDVADAGQIHDTTLKAQTETCVTGGAILTQIQIEFVPII